MKDKHPLAEALEGDRARRDCWPQPERPTPPDERFVYPGEGTVFRGDDNYPADPKNQ
jgi:hypothetical protein